MNESLLAVLGDGVGDSPGVVGHEVGVAGSHFEVVEADDGVLLSVLLLGLVQLVHLRLYDLTRTLVALAEVRQSRLPTLRTHPTALTHKYMSIASPTVEWKCDYALLARSSPKVASWMRMVELAASSAKELQGRVSPE